MDHRRWMLVDRLFHEALSLAAPARAAFLRNAATDPAVAREVDRLLQIHERAGEFLETADLQTGSLPSPEDAAQPVFRAGDQIDRFRLVRRLGAGGMGEVWLAERADRQFDQRVALKIVRAGRASPHAMQRFVEERQLLARLEHPFITRLIDGGTTHDGRPYLVMEHVEGVAIDRYCRDRELRLADRLRLFRSVCDAVQYAHQQLIVHRDLKPANVLVADGGHPKLLDFGIAGLLESESVSVSGLTPEYASPEQLRGEPCTPAGDVYSLGVILRELVAPSSVDERSGVVTALVEAGHSPVPQRRYPPVPRRHGDLRFVIEKALDPTPERRYPTAKDLADDVDRFLQRRPVRARDATAGYRARRFVGRNIAGCTVGLLVTIGLTAAVIVGVQSWGKAGRDRDIAQAANAFLESVLGSASPFSLGMDPTVEEMLARTSERARIELIDRPEVEFRTRMTLVRAHVSLWNWEQVREESARALVLARQLYGPESKEAADCLSALGRSQAWARDSAAIETQLQVLKIRRDIFPPDDPGIAEVYTNLGFANWMAGRPPRLDDAEAFFRKGIETFRRGGFTSGPEYPRALYSYASFLLTRDKDSPHVLEWLREAVARFEQLDQPPDRCSTAALVLYGQNLVRRGNAGGGLTYLRTFVDQVPEGLAAEIPLNEAVWLIALIERARDDGDRGEESFRRALDLECRSRALRTADAEDWAAAAATVRDARDFSSLIRALYAMADRLRSSVDARDAKLLERLTIVATLGADPADIPEAVQLVESIRDTLTAHFPDRIGARHYCAISLGYLAIVEGRTDEAETMLDSAFIALRRERGQFDPCAQLAVRALVRLTEARGATGKASHFRRFLSTLGPATPH